MLRCSRCWNHLNVLARAIRQWTLPLFLCSLRSRQSRTRCILSASALPPGWDEFGYAEFDSDGRRNWFHISGNLHCLRNAGREWQRVNGKFLSSLDFVHSIVDRRIFYRHGASGIFYIICFYVDDCWTYCEDDAE